METDADVKKVFVIFLVLATALSDRRSVLVQASQQEKLLYNQLLQGYNKLVRPVKHSSNPVTVRLRFSLIDVIGVDESNGHISVKVWLTMVWKDEYLMWKPDLHGGIKRLNFLTEGSNRIWTPDITVFNSLKSDTDSNVQAVVAADGQVTWIQPAEYKVRCRHEFRGNSWVSAFKVGSWTYNEQMVNILPISDNAQDVDIDVDNYTINDQWAMLEHGGRREIRQPKECCDQQSFVSMYYLLKLRKRLGPSLLGRR